MRLGSLLPAVALLLSPLMAQAVPLPAAPKGKPVDVVLCLDTSNSMDGLIDSAKRKLWAIVNDLAKIEPAPTLRVALYSYGNNNYDPKAGWVRKDLDLTGDLDEVYKQLFSLTTKGGEEYVARVTRDALAGLKWADDKDALRILFVCGNEPVNQDKEVALDSVAAQAKARGVVINTIYCGPGNNPEVAGWAAFATRCGGKYANIDQDRAKAEVVIKTPFDDEIQKLGTKINETYLWYGLKGADAKANQLAQDRAASGVAGGVAIERSETKAGRLYKNAECDLIDRMLADKDFDLKKLKEEDLPPELKKLKSEDREAHLKKKAAERAEIQKKVTELSAKRALYMEEQRKTQPKTTGEKALDEALRSILREEAAAKGLKVKE
jgi:hypothetical protein